MLLAECTIAPLAICAKVVVFLFLLSEQFEC